MSGVRYSARLLVRKRSLCIGGQGHVQVVFFSAAAAAAVSHNPLKPGTMSSRANKVSVHTHSSHSRYRPTTLLTAAARVLLVRNKRTFAIHNFVGFFHQYVP